VLERKEVNSFMLKQCGKMVNQHLKKRKHGLMPSAFVAYEFGFYLIGDRTLYSKLVVDNISSKLSYRPEFGAILNAFRKLFLSLPNFVLSFIGRQINNIVQLLDRAALSLCYASHYTFYFISVYIMTT